MTFVISAFQIYVLHFGHLFSKTGKTRVSHRVKNDNPVTRTWKMTQMTDWPGDAMTQFHVCSFPHHWKRRYSAFRSDFIIAAGTTFNWGRKRTTFHTQFNMTKNQYVIVTYSISGIFTKFRTFLYKNCDVWYYVISMVFTEEDRVVIKFVRRNKGYGARWKKNFC